jgi:hypothetical protein
MRCCEIELCFLLRSNFVTQRYLTTTLVVETIERMQDPFPVTIVLCTSHTKNTSGGTLQKAAKATRTTTISLFWIDTTISKNNTAVARTMGVAAAGTATGTAPDLFPRKEFKVTDFMPVKLF